MDHDNYSTPRYIQVQVSTVRSSSVDVIHTLVINLKLVDVLQADGIAPCSTSNNREVKVTLECNSEEARIQLLKVVFTSTQESMAKFIDFDEQEEIRVLEAQQRQKRKRSDSNISRQRLKRDPSFILDNNVIDLTTLEAQQPQKHKLSDSNISQQRLKGDQSFTLDNNVIDLT
jgi:hypothetical protein